MKLKSEICGRELCKLATVKTRRIPIAGNTELDRGGGEGGEDAANADRRVRRIQPIRESAAIPAAKSAREGKLNNSPLHLRAMLAFKNDSDVRDALVGDLRAVTVFTRTIEILVDT